MNTENVNIKTPDGICDAFVAYPGHDKYPGVLLLMDAFGLREYLYDMAQTLASHGYFVLMPNLFYRVKKVPVPDLKFPIKAEDMPTAHAQIMPFIKGYNQPEMGRIDTKAWIEFLEQQKHVAPGKFAATGYCMGGSLAIRAAENFADRFAAVASFHAGNLAADNPQSPVNFVNQIKAEVYLGHADQDQSMPAAQIEKLHAALVTSGVKFKDEVYKGASHGYTMADLPAYNKSALEKHWAVLPDLLARTLPQT